MRGSRVIVPTVFAERVASTRLIVTRLKNGVYRRTDDSLEKRCAKCREYLPADNTAFYGTASEKDGLYSWCKACCVEWRAKREARRNKENLSRPVESSDFFIRGRTLAK